MATFRRASIGGRERGGHLCHRLHRRKHARAHADTGGLKASGSFSSGGLLSAYGWNTVLWVSFIPLVLAIAALARATRRRAPDILEE